MKLDIRRIFRKVNGSDASKIISCSIDRGAENRGIIFHEASYPDEAGSYISRMVEKKTVRRNEVLVADALKKIQTKNATFLVFPQIYYVVSKAKLTSIFMEHVEQVEDTFLHEEGSIELIISALAELSATDLKSLKRPRKITHILNILFEILSLIFIVKLTYIEKLSLIRLALSSINAMTRLPVGLSHGDLSLQNMAYNKSTNELRFIDFGSLQYNFIGSDLKNLFRSRELLQYDFYELTRKYALASGHSEKDLMLSVWLADLRRCSLRIVRARRRNIPAAIDREKKALKSILMEFEFKFRRR